MKKIESVLSHKRLQNAQPESMDSDQNDRVWENPNEQKFAFLDRKALPREVVKTGEGVAILRHKEIDYNCGYRYNIN